MASEFDVPQLIRRQATSSSTLQLQDNITSDQTAERFGLWDLSRAGRGEIGASTRRHGLLTRTDTVLRKSITPCTQFVILLTTNTISVSHACIHLGRQPPEKL